MTTKPQKGLMNRLVRLINATWPSLGRGVIRAALQEAPPRDAIRSVLSQLPIVTLTVSGKQGVFQGSAGDAGIIQRYACDGEWSPKMVDLVLKSFPANRSGTYFDIGANIGLTAIPIASSGVSVVAFEPVDTNFRHLSANCAMNQVEGKIQVENCALLEKPGTVTFEMSPRNHGDHRVRRSNDLSLMDEVNWKTTTVQARVLDDYLDLAHDPIVLKIDTQGSEPLVIQGGKELCKRARLVISEFSPYAMNRMSVDPAPMIELFSGLREVQICEAENEAPFTTLSGQALVSFLNDYFLQNKETPTRKYLNLIGAR